MSQPYQGASKAKDLSKEDRVELQKLTQEIQSRLQQLLAIGTRTLSGKEIKGAEVTEVSISAKSEGAAAARSIVCKATDSDGNCVVYRDPPGVCEPC